MKLDSGAQGTKVSERQPACGLVTMKFTRAVTQPRSTAFGRDELGGEIVLAMSPL